MPPAAEREQPQVPNHDLVRAIGRGAYGEIWLARSLTGAMRAVKIVARRTFESNKAFQREFEGMARFEPISRSDSGFVDILHVGRDEAGGFFYYVMELADDATGTPVESERYVPKTLRTELARRSRLLVDECLAIGLSLTRALGVLHRHGLVHRDIKPANIIFVGGVPKIADIGLVAATGQASFVGTEGYVPPEGPGTAQADIYSLGKVLYELAMGKDRLDFPALHTDLTRLPGPEKERLLRLNEVLLRACAPEPRERYATAAELCEDLERIRDSRPLARVRHRGPLLTALVAILALAVVGAWWWHSHAPGSATLLSEPPGAMVVIDGTMKRSPARFSLAAGTHTASVMLPGFDPAKVPVIIEPRAHAQPPAIRLTRSHGALHIASKPPGAKFTLRRGDEVVQSGETPGAIEKLSTGTYDLRVALDGREQSSQVEVKRGETALTETEFAFGKVTVTSEPLGAEILINGQPAGPAPLERALAEGPHEIIARFRGWPEQRRSVPAERAKPATVAFLFAKGSAKITSAPSGASVLREGHEIGRTPLLLEDLEPGALRCEVRLSGYKPLEVAGEVRPGEQTFLGARFVQRSGPQRGQPFENTLGMKFAPVGEVLIGVWPARVLDYEAFCRATSRTRAVADFPQEPSHPVVQVNWEDATAFCQWLTDKERAAGTLEEGQHYRLPTDLEWSEAAGLPAEGGETPEQRDGKLRDFPWGTAWPPPAGTGNFADARRGAPGIAGYRDAFPQTSPVGTFAANPLGLHDMAGNVWQWIHDSYKGGTRAKDWGVLRGGSWGTAGQAELRAAYRNVMDRTERDVIFGFRPALVPGAAE